MPCLQQVMRTVLRLQWQSFYTCLRHAVVMHFRADRSNVMSEAHPGEKNTKKKDDTSSHFFASWFHRKVENGTRKRPSKGTIGKEPQVYFLGAPFGEASHVSFNISDVPYLLAQVMRPTHWVGPGSCLEIPNKVMKF